MDPTDSTNERYRIWTQLIELMRDNEYGPNWENYSGIYRMRDIEN